MKNLHPSVHVNRLKNAYRQGNSEGLEFYIIQALKRSTAVESSPRESIEIALETARVYRMSGDLHKATVLCDNALANIPSGVADLIGELHRLRVQIYLDQGEYEQAEQLLEQIDGLEMTLHGNVTHIARKDENVKIETWLLAVETAVSQGKTAQAKNFFDKAVDKLTADENDFHKKKQLNIYEKRFLQTYFADMRDMITLFGAVLQIQFGGKYDSEFEQIRDLAARLQPPSGADNQNNLVKVANAPLLAKCRVVLNLWAFDAEKPPAGINLQEARRWFHFTKPITLVESADESLALAGEIPASMAPFDLTPAGVPTGTSVSDSQALTDIAATLRNLHQLATTLTENNKTHEMFKDKIAFAGHLMCIDIGATLRNVSESHFTGFIKFTWKPANYEGEVALGKISSDVECGTGYLFCVDGNVIDATLGQMKPSENEQAANRNFDFLIQLGWSIGLSDDTPADIRFDSIAEPVVRERKRIMNFNPDGLINRVTSITNRIFGIAEDEEEEGDFNMDGFESAFMTAQPAATAVQNPPVESSAEVIAPFAQASDASPTGATRPNLTVSPNLPVTRTEPISPSKDESDPPSTVVKRLPFDDEENLLDL